MERTKKRIQVRLQTNGVIGGDLNSIKSRAIKRSDRTPRTLNNKLTKLQAFYRRLSKQSTKSKETDKTPRVKGYFCDKYPTFADFKAVQILRERNRREPEAKKSSVNRSDLKKKGAWGI